MEGCFNQGWYFPFDLSFCWPNMSGGNLDLKKRCENLNFMDRPLLMKQLYLNSTNFINSSFSHSLESRKFLTERKIRGRGPQKRSFFFSTKAGCRLLWQCKLCDLSAVTDIKPKVASRTNHCGSGGGTFAHQHLQSRDFRQERDTWNWKPKHSAYLFSDLAHWKCEPLKSSLHVVGIGLLSPC